MRAFLEKRGILLLLAAVGLIGIITCRQYGESWDERQFFKYADSALEAYSTWPRTGTVPLTGNTYDNYGPAYVMLVALGARLLGPVVPWITSDVRHLLYLVTFVAGIWAFHRLCRRWLSGSAALGATLLLATQPLLWGHAFISPKDIPFLVFFLLSFVFGLDMADRIPERSIEAPRGSLLLLTIAWFIIVGALLTMTPILHAWIEGLVRAAAAGEGNVISRLASDIRTADPAVYIQKYFVLFLWIRAALILVLSVGLALLWWKIPGAFRLLLSVAPAAIALGLATSVRLFGPLAGVLVAAYALWKYRGKALPTILVYAGVAAAVMYISWPYLWPDPIGHFLQSAQVMAQYPWRGEVLFDGRMYLSTEIPRFYLPVLLGIQLTEPVWFLFVAGLPLAIYETFRRNSPGMPLLTLTSIWFVLPVLDFVIMRAPLYDNFRQVIFILPPVFMMTGLVFEKIRPLSARAALIVLVVLPGIVAGARLHPYEYIYYNQFVGGVQGAFRKFELDYWGTSYREAAGYLNEIAPANATVWVEGPTHLLQVYTRPDLKIYSTYEAARASHYDYVVALTRFNLDLTSYPQAPIVHTIERQGALLTVIKKP